MRKIVLLFILPFLFVSFTTAQENESGNAAEKLLKQLEEQKIVIGGYGQIDYNQPISSGIRENGKLDVHRLVMLFGYSFSPRTSLVTELEYEHVKEVYVEQAFIEHRIANGFNLVGGLMLIPMGIVNEFHEPTTYNGVERPSIDSRVVPTTWREIGAGFTGVIPSASLSYKALIVNGFKSYDGEGTLGGSKSIRGGRQKGAESFISNPNFSAKVNYFGISGLQIGLSTYLGKTQSTLFDSLDKSDSQAEARADSSQVGINMLGFDYRFTSGNFHSRGQYIYNKISNTKAYNEFTGNDLGESILGWYLEGAYDIALGNGQQKLTPFIRFEKYDLHNKTASITPNNAYNVKEIFAGVGYTLSPGVVWKADMQWVKPDGADEARKQFNMGIGFWF